MGLQFLFLKEVMAMKIFLKTGVSLVAATLVGCSSLPGSDSQQGAVIGGASGAAVGAAVSENRAIGALIGGALGAAGGYVVGANKDKILGRDTEGAEEASEASRTEPATPQEVLAAKDADANNDGFVTLDEVIAMEQAGLSDQEMIDRLRATGQIFDLSEEQQRYLRDRGVSAVVVQTLPTINADQREEILTAPDDPVVGRERPVI